MALDEMEDAYRKEFLNLKTQPQDFMDEIQGRQICPKCNKSRKFYCYTCYILMDELKNKLKTVKLPIKVDIIKHRNEVDGKSTAPHARVVAPDDVNIYEYPCIPDYDRDKVVLVFPCEESVLLSELLNRKIGPSKTNDSEIHNQEKQDLQEDGEDQFQTKGDNSCNSNEKKTPESNKRKIGSESIEDGGTNFKVPKTDLKTFSNDKSANLDKNYSKLCAEYNWKFCPSFEKVVFIDSTWLQAKAIFLDERLKGLRKVELKTRKTKFWRPQGAHPETYLSTIEAIYYFIKDFHQTFISDNDGGDYDNLLFFFLYTYSKIQKSKGSKKTCKR